MCELKIFHYNEWAFQSRSSGEIANIFYDFFMVELNNPFLDLPSGVLLSKECKDVRSKFISGNSWFCFTLCFLFIHLN